VPVFGGLPIQRKVVAEYMSTAKRIKKKSDVAGKRQMLREPAKSGLRDRSGIGREERNDDKNC